MAFEIEWVQQPTSEVQCFAKPSQLFQFAIFSSCNSCWQQTMGIPPDLNPECEPAASRSELSSAGAKSNDQTHFHFLDLFPTMHRHQRPHCESTTMDTAYTYNNKRQKGQSKTVFL